MNKIRRSWNKSSLNQSKRKRSKIKQERFLKKDRLEKQETQSKEENKTIKENIDRKILLLSDRIEHLNLLENILKEEKIDFVSVVLFGFNVCIFNILIVVT